MAVSKTSPSMRQLVGDHKGNYPDSPFINPTGLSLGDAEAVMKRTGQNASAGANSLNDLKGYITGIQPAINSTSCNNVRDRPNRLVYTEWWPEGSQALSATVLWKNNVLFTNSQLNSKPNKDYTHGVNLVGYTPTSGNVRLDWDWETNGVTALSKGIVEVLGYTSGVLQGTQKRYIYEEFTSGLAATNYRSFNADGAYPYFMVCIRAFCPENSSTGAAAYTYGLKISKVRAYYA